MTTKEQVKALWQCCFDDSEAFVEMYFNLRYKEERNFASVGDGKVVSAFQLLPYPMTFCGEIIPTSYISGACTHPDFRNKGIMSRLLTASFEQMRQTGVCLSTLIPAEPRLFDYYAKLGYASVFHHSTKELKQPSAEAPSSEESTVEAISDFRPEVYAYLNRKLSEHPCCLQHTEEDFRVILADLSVSNGRLLAARRNNEVVGTAVLYEGETHIKVDCLLAETPAVEQQLLHAAQQSARDKRTMLTLPPDKDNLRQALGMARIIDALRLLSIFAAAFPEKEMLLNLSDGQLPANNGFYHLSGGKCRYSPRPSSDPAAVAIHISELAKKVLTRLSPYMCLMLN